MSHAAAPEATDPREQLRAAIAHFEHVLPAQAPLRDFVHHNTLHGFQHLPFPQALEAARKITGNTGYLPDEQFRALFHAGRIDPADLDASLDADDALNADTEFCRIDTRVLRQRDIYRAALIHPLKPVTPSQLNWQIEARDALRRFQSDVAQDSRTQLLTAAGTSEENAAISDLWQACLQVLRLEHYILHPEEMLDLTAAQAERMLAQVVGNTRGTPAQPMVHALIDDEADKELDHLLARVGHTLTLRGLLELLTGNDLLDDLRPLVIRHVANYLDQGMAAWHHPDRAQGFYAAWRDSATRDLFWSLEDIAEWGDDLDSLPNDALDCIIAELKRIGVPHTRWTHYLERLALDIPGWSGMVLWRHGRPGYENLVPDQVSMLDYLAVRLVLERLFASRLCRSHWHIEPSLDVLRWYFNHHRAEFLVRHTLFTARLPEYLATQAQRLVAQVGQAPYDAEQWEHLAQMIWTWQHSPSADRLEGYSVHRSAWRLFRLAQHLGLPAAAVRRFEPQQIASLFACLERLTPERCGYLWLTAYERHYRDQVFNAVVKNHGRGPWRTRDTRPAAQIVFCMDDREEGIRRHLEETNPRIETLGAAGFFGVAINWRGLDDSTVTPLCPVVVTPAHEIREQPQANQEQAAAQHTARRTLRLRIKDLLFQETRRNLLTSTALIAVAAPAALAVLTLKLLAPLRLGRWSEQLRARFDREVPTRIAINATDTETAATPATPRLGFTDTEQADRVQNFLRTIGLTSGFAPLVVMMGHGSISQNNPHLAAYDCGACSGRHGGPNARVFAALANRAEIRALLRERGIDIPDDTWFLGAEHNTCDENIIWYDLEAVPAMLRPALAQLQADLRQAVLGSAHERARRFASAPRNPTPLRALKHIIGRSYDFSQARPELGHATNAAAFIGRRSLSRGAFFDRRVFLISYDPSQDPEGKILEAILLAAGPVGAGINLEYYFSTVNNERYGCGSKITHNVTGLFGVMDGASSDLRTGLPKQMIEIHEAMRLQVLVESTVDIVTQIYQRQPPLQELVGNGWLLLSVKDMHSDAIHVFDPARGFLRWQGPSSDLPTVNTSPQWYNGHHDPLAPALLERPIRLAEVQHV